MRNSSCGHGVRARMSELKTYPPDQRWLVRVEGSGVWLGAVFAGPGPFAGSIMLEHARRAHRWQGAIDCSDLALTGPAETSRVTEATTVAVRLDRILETHPMTSDALALLKACPVARAEK